MVKVLSKRTFFFYLSTGIFSLSCRQPTLPPPIQAHIDRLCEQIDDLALQLAEERLNHKQTRLKVSDFSLVFLLPQTKECHLDWRISQQQITRSK